MTRKRLDPQIESWVDRLEGELFPFVESEFENESFTDVGRDRVRLVLTEFRRRFIDGRIEMTETPKKGAPDYLRAMVISYDSNDSMAFLAALYHARRFLGLKLADEEEERRDREVLEANGLLEEVSHD